MNTDTRVRDTRGRRKKDSGSLLKGLVRRLRKAWFSYAAGTAWDTSDESEHALLATRAIAELYRRHACEVELESTSQACRG